MPDAIPISAPPGLISPCVTMVAKTRLIVSELDTFKNGDSARSPRKAARYLGLSGFPNAETLNLTMSYVDVGLIGHRVQTRKGPV